MASVQVLGHELASGDPRLKEYQLRRLNVGPRDWPQWGGTSVRNNAPAGQGIPADWDPGRFDRDTGQWLPGTSRNVGWVVRLGSETYASPVVANGKMFIGTNNAGGYTRRFPPDVDLGCLLCFRESDGRFLWQLSRQKLPSGREHDWRRKGLVASPLVDGDRLWVVSNRCEVLCLDAEGFHDGQNDGPLTDEAAQADDEADVVWAFDMFGQLGVRPHNMSSCSVTLAGDSLFVNTSNGVNESHLRVPAPDAPSFIALEKNTGALLWQDSSPGADILHGQWSSPASAVLEGVPQVIFGGGDGWLYSFRAEGGPDGKAELLWKFDCNPKQPGARGMRTRNQILGTPVIYDGLVYIAVGEDPEHGEGSGRLWCIAPTARGDISAELVVDFNQVVANPNSGAVWHYTEFDWDGDGQIAEFEERMHRTCSTAVIVDGLLFIPDFSGLVHCLDAKTGEVHWTHDVYAAIWGSCLAVDGKVYVGDEEGKVTVFKLSAEKEVLGQVHMGTAIYSTPVVANNVLYLATFNRMFAIRETAARME